MNKAALIPIIVLIACGTPDRQPDDTVTSQNIESVRHFTITAIDTIGTEFGDSNYVFGQTDVALFGPDGEILVLDG